MRRVRVSHAAGRQLRIYFHGRSLPGMPPGDGCTRKETGKVKKQQAMSVNQRPPRKRRTALSETKAVWMLPPEEHQKRLELHRQGMSDGQIARECGVSTGAIAYWRKRNYIPANMDKGGGHVITQEEHDRRMALYAKGMSDPAIAKALGISKNTVAKWRDRNGLPASYTNYGKFLPNEWNQGGK